MTERKRGWKRVKFGEVVRLVKSKADPETSGLERYVAGEHMDTDDLRIRRWGQIGDGYIGPAFHMRFKPGQVLYGSRRTYLRKVAVADFEGICANTTFVLESADPTKLLPEFLPFVMQTEAFHEHSKRESKGSVNPYVNFSDLAWYEFALPPLEEQRRIAALLKTARAAREAASAAESAARGVAGAHVQRVLTSFREAHPETLATTVLDRLTVGIVVKPADWYTDSAQGVPALRSLNVSPGALVLDDLVRITREGHAAHEKSQLRSGDVVVVRTGRPGEAAVIPASTGPLNCIDLIVTTPSDKLDPHYFALVLNSSFGKRIFSAGATGTAQQHFNVGAFKRLRLPLPPRDVQESLVADASAIRNAAASLGLRARNTQEIGRMVLRDMVVS